MVQTLERTFFNHVSSNFTSAWIFSCIPVITYSLFEVYLSFCFILVFSLTLQLKQRDDEGTILLPLHSSIYLLSLPLSIKHLYGLGVRHANVLASSNYEQQWVHFWTEWHFWPPESKSEVRKSQLTAWNQSKIWTQSQWAFREITPMFGKLKADKNVEEGQTDLPFQGGTHWCMCFKDARQDAEKFLAVLWSEISLAAAGHGEEQFIASGAHLLISLYS